jgi:hypothetical protein
MIKAFSFILLSFLCANQVANAQELRGSSHDAFIFEDHESHRTLSRTCPSRVSATYQRNPGVTPCTKNSDCAGWMQDGDGCCLYPYCICGAKNTGASSTVSCLADSVQRSEPPSSPLPAINIPTRPTSKRPTVMPTTRTLTMRPTTRPTMRQTARPTMRPTTRPTMRQTARPTMRQTARPTMRPTVRPILRTSPPVNRNDPPSPAVIDITPQSRRTLSPTKTRTCPSDVSSFYQSITGASVIIPCTKNADCAGWTQDGPGCCLHPFCICGARNTGSSSVTCLSF